MGIHLQSAAGQHPQAGHALIFLSLAELYSQRAGLVHIGLEGLAAIGSLVGFLVSLITGSPMLGVAAGAAVGILVNLVFAYATVTLCAEQIVYGMAINIFAPALAAFIYRVYFGAGSASGAGDADEQPLRHPWASAPTTSCSSSC